MQGYVNYLLMTYGIVFQEFYEPDSFKGSNLRKRLLRMIWVFATVLLTASYAGNLKSNLIKKTYEPKTQTMNEMIDKDMPVHLSKGFFNYLDSTKHLSKLSTRLTCQASKDKSKLYPITLET